MIEIFEATDLPLFPWLTSPKPRFVRIVPDSITGRSFRVAFEAGRMTARPTAASSSVSTGPRSAGWRCGVPPRRRSAHDAVLEVV